MTETAPKTRKTPVEKATEAKDKAYATFVQKRDIVTRLEAQLKDATARRDEAYSALEYASAHPALRNVPAGELEDGVPAGGSPVPGDETAPIS